MYWDQIESKWKQLRGATKLRSANLSDDAPDLIADKRVQLVSEQVQWEN